MNDAVAKKTTVHDDVDVVARKASCSTASLSSCAQKNETSSISLDRITSNGSTATLALNANNSRDKSVDGVDIHKVLERSLVLCSNTFC